MQYYTISGNSKGGCNRNEFIMEFKKNVQSYTCLIMWIMLNRIAETATLSTLNALSYFYYIPLKSLVIAST